MRIILLLTVLASSMVLMSSCNYISKDTSQIREVKKSELHYTWKF